MVGLWSSIGPDAAPYTHAFGRVHFMFNEANVNYGQHINIGTNLATNIFAGISFAHVKQELLTIYADENASDDDAISRTTKVPSSFIGASHWADRILVLV